MNDHVKINFFASTPEPCSYLDNRKSVSAFANPHMDMDMGNVRERSFVDIWADSPVFENLRSMDYKGKCGICDHKDICGGCRARTAFYHKGDYMASEPWCGYKPG